MSLKATTKEAVQGWLMVLPAVLLLGAFTHWPTIQTLFASMHTHPVPGHPSEFDAMSNQFNRHAKDLIVAGLGDRFL